MALDARAADLVMRPLTRPVLGRDTALTRRAESELSKAAQPLSEMLAHSLLSHGHHQGIRRQRGGESLGRSDSGAQGGNH